jgi:flagellar biogenesis protein FliO
MKKYLLIITAIFMLTAQRAFCITETVSPELGKVLKLHTHDPSFLSVIFALVVVVCLIYITGLIYAKLNVVGAKTVQQHFRNYDLSKVIVISTTQLGQNKNLHVVELNKKRYLIGATPTSINLIKELDESKDKIKAEEKTGPKTDSNGAEVVGQTFDDAIEVLYGKDDAKPELELESVKEFDVHKKYL